MAENVVLVATGADRPGVMDELSQFLLDCGGNINDSRSVNLHGRFALLLLVRGESGLEQCIRNSLPRLAEQGITAEVHATTASRPAELSTFPHVFIATGTDQKGVLHRISHLLRALKINIDDIRTHVADDSSFEIRLTLAVPRETPVTMLKEYLAFLCQELGIKGELREA
jgi:glycine cleavage system transcriptional repressor